MFYIFIFKIYLRIFIVHIFISVQITIRIELILDTQNSRFVFEIDIFRNQVQDDFEKLSLIIDPMGFY